jgi:hypothetical protein
MATDVQAPDVESITLDADDPMIVNAPPLNDYRYKITVEQYDKMADAGVFGPDAPVELLEGLLVRKMTKNPPHVIASELLDRILHRVVPVSGWFVSMANPMSIPDHQGEPEPDGQVVRGDPRDYAKVKHGPGDAALVIEVSHTSYPLDRSHKLVSYAKALVPVYWILNLNERRLEVYTEPVVEADRGYYRQCRFLGPDDEVPLILDGREVARIAVRDILP